MEELEETQAEAIDRAIGAEMHASLCGTLAWLLLIPQVLVALVFFVNAFTSPRGQDGMFLFGLLSLFSGALSYMTPMVFRHVLEMKATSLKLQVDAMPD